MTRVGKRFSELRRDGRPGFVAFITAGDPSLERTIEIACGLEQAGVDVLELGVPFSDPLADGPVIQRASDRSLARGTTLARVLEVVRRIRERSAIPIILFTYYNPMLRFGLERFGAEARRVGVDGVLVTDLPPEEAEEWLRQARGQELDTIFLVAPTSPPERLRQVAEACRGFVYAVSRTGVTGERQSLSDEAAPLLAAVRAHTREPVALGFGISTPEQVAEAARLADAVVVGSSLVRFLEQNPEGDLAEHARWLRQKL
jgi:tryptophan synthase alpha chain